MRTNKVDKLRSEGYETLKELLLEKVKDILNERIIQKARQDPKVPEKVRTMEIDDSTTSSAPQSGGIAFGKGGKKKAKEKVEEKEKVSEKAKLVILADEVMSSEQKLFASIVEKLDTTLTIVLLRNEKNKVKARVERKEKVLLKIMRRPTKRGRSRRSDACRP